MAGQFSGSIEGYSVCQEYVPIRQPQKGLVCIRIGEEFIPSRGEKRGENESFDEGSLRGLVVAEKLYVGLSNLNRNSERIPCSLLMKSDFIIIPSSDGP